jgi:BON domain
MRLVNFGNTLGTSFRPGAKKMALAAALAFAISLPAFAQQGQRDDAAIEADIVNVLNSSPTLKSQQITAATIGGDVTLSGTVRDEASKELAEMAVSRVAGVKSVENHLTVGQGNTAPQPLPQDQSAPQPMEQGAPDASMPQQPSAPVYGSRPPYTPDASVSSAPRGPVVIPQGTLLKVWTSEPLDSKHTQPGAMVEFTAANDIYSGGALAIPRGAVLEGQVVDVQNANSGSITGRKAISLKLNSLVLEGRTYVLDSDVWTAQGSGKGGYTASNTAAGAAIGAVIGAIAGGGTGAAIGAVAGGATGVAASAATSGPQVLLPPETLVTFHLANAVTVIPVSAQEAQRLATAQGGNRPSLHYREAYGYPPPPVAVYPYPYPYYYYYPYPYYHRYYRHW